MPTLLSHAATLRRIAPALALVLTPLFAGWGCGSAQVRRVIIEADELGPSSGAAVDVSCFRGAVTVKVDRDLAQPRVRAKLHAGEHRSLAERAAQYETVSINVEPVVQEGGPVLVVSATASAETADDVWVELLVRVPDCRGLRVVNSGGTVRALGVAGAIQIENGFEGRPGGPIEVRTDQPLHAPVILATSDGQIDLQMPPASTGTITLQTAAGRARFIAQGGVVTEARAQPGQWSGILNHGSNAIELRSGSGDVAVRAIPNAMSFIPPR